jgi:hypothetical protein
MMVMVMMRSSKVRERYHKTMVWDAQLAIRTRDRNQQSRGLKDFSIELASLNLSVSVDPFKFVAPTTLSRKTFAYMWTAESFSKFERENPRCALSVRSENCALRKESRRIYSVASTHRHSQLSESWQS